MRWIRPWTILCLRTFASSLFPDQLMLGTLPGLKKKPDAGHRRFGPHAVDPADDTAWLASPGHPMAQAAESLSSSQVKATSESSWPAAIFPSAHILPDLPCLFSTPSPRHALTRHRLPCRLTFCSVSRSHPQRLPPTFPTRSRQALTGDGAATGN
ncbi:hypothetical protein V8C44DRAFT_346851 [Trichoderma aethiopicum]